MAPEFAAQFEWDLPWRKVVRRKSLEPFATKTHLQPIDALRVGGHTNLAQIFGRGPFGWAQLAFKHLKIVLVGDICWFQHEAVKSNAACRMNRAMLAHGEVGAVGTPHTEFSCTRLQSSSQLAFSARLNVSRAL